VLDMNRPAVGQVKDERPERIRVVKRSYFL
jgi:hypothetical protein